MKAGQEGKVERIGVSNVAIAFESINFAYRIQPDPDYGIDGHAELVVSEAATGQLLGIQVKAGTSYFKEKSSDGYIFRLDAEHYDYWINHSLPVVICLSDITSKIVYWQHIAEDHVESTGSGFKLRMPFDQTVDDGSKEKLKSIVTPIVPSTDYTIFETDDVSHGTAKRYSFKVVVNTPKSKPELAAIVRQVTREGRKQKYFRNEIVQRQWQDHDASVVWAFIYMSAEDYSQNNWVCQSAWISENLAVDARPIALDGENAGDGIVINWNTYNESFSKIKNHRTLTKEEYLNIVLPLFYELQTCSSFLANFIPGLRDGSIMFDHFLEKTVQTRGTLDRIYLESMDMDIAPFECREVDSRFQELLASLHNIVILFGDIGGANWSKEQKIYLSEQHLEEALIKYNQIEYEITKIR